MSLKRDDSDRYTWFGIEKPFPWILLAWPVLWLWGTLRDAVSRTGYFLRHGELHPEVIGKPLVRLWDRDYNLVHTVKDEDGMTATVDEDGTRSISFNVCMFPDGPGWTLIGTTAIGSPVYVRDESYVWKLPDDPFDISPWLGTVADSPWHRYLYQWPNPFDPEPELHVPVDLDRDPTGDGPL